MKYKLTISKKYNFEEEILINPDSQQNLNIEDINEINEHLDIPKIKNCNEYFKNFLLALKTERININMFSKKQINEYRTYLLSSIKRTLNFPIKYFLTNHLVRKRLYSRISDAKYKDSTKTGRVKIVSGTNFLTVKKEKRKSIFKISKDEVLLEIDFKSCEPNFYCQINNISIEKDLYLELIEKFNIKDSREKVKRGILTLIYGGSSDLVKKFMSVDNKTIKQIKEFLKVDMFSKSINEQIEKNGYMLNYYNRPIVSIQNPLNYFIQSSTADFCCLAFENFLKNKKFLKLHALIHDAIIISCNKNYIPEIINIDKIKDPHSGIEIPVKVRNINEEKITNRTKIRTKRHP